MHYYWTNNEHTQQSISRQAEIDQSQRPDTSREREPRLDRDTYSTTGEPSKQGDCELSEFIINDHIMILNGRKIYEVRYNFCFERLKWLKCLLDAVNYHDENRNLAPTAFFFNSNIRAMNLESDRRSLKYLVFFYKEFLGWFYRACLSFYWYLRNFTFGGSFIFIT